jgi:autotransporter-associated beta strand protein
MYLLLNLGIGGWPGDPPAGEDVNKTFDIDWVRVWQAPDAAQSNYIGPAGGNQNWDDIAKWSSGAPKLASTTAFFGNLSGGTSVTLDWVDTKVVRGLTFRTGSSYRIGWADDLLMLSVWDSASTATESVIDVQTDSGVTVQGTQAIASRVELNSDTRVKNATANALTFASDIHGRGALTLDSGRTTFNGAVLHRGGTYVVGSADATFTKILGTSADVIQVGTAAGSSSTLRITSPTATPIAASHLRLGDAGGAGTLLQSGGAVTVTGGEVWVGQGAGSTGNYNQSAGSLTLGNWLAIGRSGATGTYRLSGNAVLSKLGAGNLIIGSLGGTGSFIQTGGTVNVQSGNTLLGEDAGANGTYTISGGAATLRDIILSQRGTGSGTFNLDGGTVTANRITRAGTGPATFNFNGGTLRAAGDNVDLMSSLTAANVEAGGARIDTNALNVTLSQPLRHDPSLGATPDGGLTKTGAGTLALTGANTYTGNTTVQSGTLRVSGSIAPSAAVSVQSGATLQIDSTQTLRNVSLANDARLTISPAGSNALKIEGFTFDPGSLTDITNNALIADYAPAGTNPLQTIRSAILTAYNNGTWTGPGITSSTVAAGATNSVAVGYGESATLLGPTGGSFAGVPADVDAVLLRYTLKGDASLDGLVNFNDLATLAQNYNTTDGQRTWAHGDFTYDGIVDFNDLAALAQNYNTTLTPAQLAAFTPDFAEDFARATAQVPEPTAAIALVLTGAILSRRRGRGSMS